MKDQIFVRGSWYFSLAELLLKPSHLRPCFQEVFTTEANNNNAKIYVKNLGLLHLDNKYQYPTIKQYQRLTKLYKLKFPEIYPWISKKRRYKVFGEHPKFLRLGCKIYPFGLGASIIETEIEDIGEVYPFFKNLRVEMKNESKTVFQTAVEIKKWVIESLFSKEYQQNVRPNLEGPILNIHLLCVSDKNMSIDRLYQLISASENSQDANRVFGREEGDMIIFTKKGTVALTAKFQEPKYRTSRKYLRSNISFVTDLTFGISHLLANFKHLIKTLNNHDPEAIQKFFQAVFITMNPKIIATQSYSDVLLPRKGLQTWFKHLSGLLKIEEKFKETAFLLEEEMSELPVNIWTKLVKEFTTRQIPTISSFMKQHLKKRRIAPIESIDEIANLNDCDIEILELLIEEYAKESRESILGKGSESTGYLTRNKIQKKLGEKAKTRRYEEIDESLNKLYATKLVCFKEYKGPGASSARKNLWKINDNHPYINTRLKKLVP